MFEQDIYENAKFNPISEKLESCDKFTQTYNQDAENHDVEKKTYIKPKFHECISPISDWVLSFDECIINYLNNKYNRNKKDILDKIYYVDEFGIEYWHGESIESKEATKEEQEEMEKMLESFKEMEEDIN